ncbi:hypothetical protein [Phenylobacterium sp. J367]|uniref:hypothetical protein n=1 Tax=Phenylobacterium sp. J367 TaxID=2898435 RepID=UPI00215146D4|nr:hypothetical protein [Phenylobacterium sp. J367]MCR5877792.1 hypothetical protein [Phenylobacterium sp. J367]
MALSTRYSQRPTMSATRARQGRLGRHILWVLVFGLALVVLGFFAAYAWKSGDLASTEVHNGKQPADAQAFNAPEPAAVNTPPPLATQPGSAQGEPPPAPVGQ